MASTRVFALCVYIFLVGCLNIKGLQGELTCPQAVVNQTMDVLFKVFPAEVAQDCSVPLPTSVQFEFIRKGATSGNPVCAPVAYPPASCDGTITCGGCVEQGPDYYVYHYQFKVDDAKEGGRVAAVTCPASVKECPVISFATPAPATETPAPTTETPVNSGSSKACGSLCIGVIVGVVVCSRTEWTSI